MSSVILASAVNGTPLVSHYQMSEKSSKPGNYQLAIRAINPIIDPGEIVRYEVFVTGYGEISTCKVGMYTSNSLYDGSKSEAYVGYDLIGNEIRYGHSSFKISPIGFSIILPDILISSDNKYRTSIFGDINDSSNIASEMKLGRAPIEINLKTLDSIKPGNYTCSFYMTYFNGVEWKGDTQKIQFTIRNILQRNEIFSAIIAVTAALIAILSPIVTGVWRLFLFYCNRTSKK